MTTSGDKMNKYVCPKCYFWIEAEAEQRITHYRGHEPVEMDEVEA